MKFIEKTKKFIEEVKIEMQKVTWPSRRELINSTVVVMIGIFVLALFIGVEDKIFALILEKIILR